MPSGLDQQKSESHPMVQTGIPFRVRSKLAMSFIVFGLLATLILAISVAANYWLYTSEPIDISEQVIANLKASGKFDEDAGPPPPGAYVSVINTFSGLWKVCVSSEADKESPDEQQEISCGPIAYFGQEFKRVDGAETTWAINRGIRKATPVILISLLLMIAAEILSIMGYLREDIRTLIGGVLSIIGALSLALGQIFYISAVNDEVSQWKKPENADETMVFAYSYGWSFYASGMSFLCAMICAVGHITQYLSRYSGDVKELLVIVPGLNVKGIARNDSPSSGHEIDSPDQYKNKHNSMLL